MINLERAAQAILDSLPVDHPDRKKLEEYVAEFRVENLRAYHEANPQPWNDTPRRATSFTDDEKEALLKDGAFVYLPEGKTISDQARGKELFWGPLGRIANCSHKISDDVLENLRRQNTNKSFRRVLAFPSRKLEVAIYPDPERFFVPQSFHKLTMKQDELMEQDAESLRQELGLKGITMWRPEVAYLIQDERNITRFS